jgi:hypothetical protein
MSGAILLELGHPAQGHERQALELVNDFLERVERLLAEDKISAFRWYGLEDGDLARRAALIVLEGSARQLDAVAGSDGFREFRYAAPSLLQGFGLSRARPPDDVGPDGASVLTAALERWGLLAAPES